MRFDITGEDHCFIPVNLLNYMYGQENSVYSVSLSQDTRIPILDLQDLDVEVVTVEDAYRAKNWFYREPEKVWNTPDRRINFWQDTFNTLAFQAKLKNGKYIRFSPDRFMNGCSRLEYRADNENYNGVDDTGWVTAVSLRLDNGHFYNHSSVTANTYLFDISGVSGCTTQYAYFDGDEITINYFSRGTQVSFSLFFDTNEMRFSGFCFYRGSERVKVLCPELVRKDKAKNILRRY